MEVGGLTWLGAQELTQSQRKRRKQEESEYAPALDVTDIVTECDKARERHWWNWIILLQGLRPTWDSDPAHNKQLLKTNYKKKTFLTVFLREREKGKVNMSDSGFSEAVPGLSKPITKMNSFSR